MNAKAQDRKSTAKLAGETQDVGTTPRKPLTPRERLAMFEAFGGRCQLCQQMIVGTKWRDEHMRALGLGGTNKWDNRAPVHIECAEAKNKDDLTRIAKAKRQKQAHLGIKAPRKPIQSAPFPETEKPKRSDRKASIDKSVLPQLGLSNIARRFGPK